MFKTPKKSFQVQTNTQHTGGRYIPNRVSSALSGFTKSEPLPNKLSYCKILESLLPLPTNLLNYKPLPVSSPDISSSFSTLLPLRSCLPRQVPHSPYKILDAPGFPDDYYLNILDWGPNNHIAAGLAQNVFILHPVTGKVTKFCNLQNPVTSLSFNSSGNQLAVGTSSGSVLVYDTQVGRVTSSFHSHSDRVGVLSWNSTVISSGSADHNISHSDSRSKDTFAKFQFHKDEVCGLKWNADGRLVASGGNDNTVVLWSIRHSRPVFKFTEHTAAVKALAWSPHKSCELASGGGSSDKTIRLWDTQTLTKSCAVNTQSQICSLVFSNTSNELVSAHGPPQNEIAVWELPGMQKEGVMLGHSSRVLHLALSPDSKSLLSGSGDETLRFWKVFSCTKNTELKWMIPSEHFPR